ncbi:hypothetical protein O9Z70_11380 [Devosia sp. YIM 151766]|uniref:hypothetical protein n=1 Tax=Devosia sp. YIM 151766 TaxID=3017325 RepID=UPI00255CB00F|nr:hypothetical protein [Devosia sp. YIM 151766]WIY52075.1 hypothetical protein O9Z70_11380 [Devosia sp. YIM 151766]
MIKFLAEFLEMLEQIGHSAFQRWQVNPTYQRAQIDQARFGDFDELGMRVLHDRNMLDDNEP